MTGAVEETQLENGCNVCPSGGVVFIDPPRRLDAEAMRGIEEMAEFYLRKYGKNPIQRMRRADNAQEIQGAV